MTEFCCHYLEYVLKDHKVASYDPVTRVYSIDLLTGFHKELWYCPWCGTKMPENLDTIWQRTLREEYGLKDPIFDDADKVPPEFKTDEWWKKRGL